MKYLGTNPTKDLMTYTLKPEKKLLKLTETKIAQIEKYTVLIVWGTRYCKD